jgi:uncharacterized oligopeptide transporter (OPT) family protein
MKLVAEGVMGEGFPWGLFLGGVALGLFFSLLRLPALAVAVGLYLPVHITFPLIFGGLIRWLAACPGKASGGAPEGGAAVLGVKGTLTGRDGAAEAARFERVERGILFSSGLVAGEGIVGIVLAVLAVLHTNISLAEEPVLGGAAAVLAFGVLCWALLRAAVSGKGGA